MLPTADNYGTLPLGTTLDGHGVIVDRSLTAYLCDASTEADRLIGSPQMNWVGFAHVHPLRSVEPLVRFG